MRLKEDDPGSLYSEGYCHATAKANVAGHGEERRETVVHVHDAK
jgi:hypothetical protein